MIKNSSEKKYVDKMILGFIIMKRKLNIIENFNDFVDNKAGIIKVIIFNMLFCGKKDSKKTE